jgi:hypothetical protein
MMLKKRIRTDCIVFVCRNRLNPQTTHAVILLSAGMLDMACVG